MFLDNILFHTFQVFPEALFHQLLLAMVHPDHETRVAAHRIFSVVLVPSYVSPLPCLPSLDQCWKHDIQRTLSRTASVFSSSAALFDKLRRDKNSFRENIQEGSMNRILHCIEDETAISNDLTGLRSLRHSFRVPSVSQKYPSTSLKECQNSLTETHNESVCPTMCNLINLVQCWLVTLEKALMHNVISNILIHNFRSPLC
jgi:protein EFR3